MVKWKTLKIPSILFLLIFDIIDPFFTFILYQYQYGCYAQDRDDHSRIPIFYTLEIMEQSWVVSRSIPIATLMVYTYVYIHIYK